MVDFRVSSSVTQCLAIGLVIAARKVSAHGHNMEKIQEGEHMSAEPIVGWE